MPPCHRTPPLNSCRIDCEKQKKQKQRPRSACGLTDLQSVLAPDAAACLLQPPTARADRRVELQCRLPPAAAPPSARLLLQLKSVIRRTKETPNVHPMYREGLLRRKMGPIIVNKSNSQDRLIEELQGKLGIGRGERPVRRKQQPDDWLTEGVIVMSNPQRTREERSNPPVDKVAPPTPSPTGGGVPPDGSLPLVHVAVPLSSPFLVSLPFLSVSFLSLLPSSLCPSPPPTTPPDPPPSRISCPTEESPPPTAVPLAAQKAGSSQADSSPAAPASSPASSQPSPTPTSVSSPTATTQGAHASPSKGSYSSTCPPLTKSPSQARHAPSASQGFRVSRLSDRV